MLRNGWSSLQRNHWPTFTGIRKQARTAYQASYFNKPQVTRKALRPIYAMREKLSGLVFLDPLIPETIRVIDETLAALPDKGPLEGTTLNLLAGLVGRQLANLGRATSIAPADEDDPLMDILDEVENLVSSRSIVYGTSTLTWDF